MKQLSTRALVIVGVLGLAACGGGGGGPVSGLGEIGEQAGLSAPIETPSAQQARAAGIASRSDSLIMSTVRGETSHPDLPGFAIRARCSGTRCDLYEPGSGYSGSVSLSDFEIAQGPAEAVGTKHGITLMSKSTQDVSSFGAWMEHAAFATQSQDGTVEGVRITLRNGMAGGGLTGTGPSGSATWLGLMVGTPIAGADRGDRLVGTAALNYDMDAGGGLDVALGGIENVDLGTAHTTQTVLFSDVPLSPGGTFEAGLAGNRIQGGFFGPGHAEVAGIFEQADIVGAFGARRQ